MQQISHPLSNSSIKGAKVLWVFFIHSKVTLLVRSQNGWWKQRFHHYQRCAPHREVRRQIPLPKPSLSGPKLSLNKTWQARNKMPTGPEESCETTSWLRIWFSSPDKFKVRWYHKPSSPLVVRKKKTCRIPVELQTLLENPHSSEPWQTWRVSLIKTGRVNSSTATFLRWMV